MKTTTMRDNYLDKHLISLPLTVWTTYGVEYDDVVDNDKIEDCNVYGYVYDERSDEEEE